MEARINPTEADILDALRAAMEKGTESADALTSAELAAKLQVSNLQIRKLLEQLLASGDAYCVNVRRRSIAGRATSVPGYRLKP